MPGLASSLMLALACNGGSDSDSASTTDTRTDLPAPTVEVLVQDPDGAPLPDALVMMGGWDEDRWVVTDSEGRATVTLEDAGYREQYLHAGKVGWFSGGEELDFDEPQPELLTLVMRPLPAEDNPDYGFQPGGDGSSMDTSECGHCHWTIGDDWAGSRHARAADNPAVWDLYTGSAAAGVDEAACEELGGWLDDGATPGEPDTPQSHCYVGAGVLPWLHEDCGTEGDPACDHPDQAASLEHFGSCGDCHSPAFDGAAPGRIDLAAATGVAREGVTCDFCHKIASVTPGPTPGLDGGIALVRPSDPSPLPNLAFEAITFGPYPDVLVPIMNGSYAPQYTDSDWCGACHELAQPALHPDESGSVDTSRWPDGVPIFETWSEYGQSAMAGSIECQGCHMPSLPEESSTYDITDQGLEPSLDQGWPRETGQVRHHRFDRQGLGAPRGEVAVEADRHGVVAPLTVSNPSAAHAVPTGEPMKQLYVLVGATDGDGEIVPASGGQVIPDVGGYAALGVLGQDLALDGSDLTFDGATLPDEAGLAVRFVRPTGDWVDYPGPGTPDFWGADLSPEERGLPVEDFVAERAVASIDGDTLTFDGAAPDLVPGDRAYVVREGDLAGAPGWLFAKVLVDAQGERGVAHYRAVGIASDNRIAAGGQASSTHHFEGQDLSVSATLVRRDRSAMVARVYGWDTQDVEVRAVEGAVGE